MQMFSFFSFIVSRQTDDVDHSRPPRSTSSATSMSKNKISKTSTTASKGNFDYNVLYVHSERAMMECSNNSFMVIFI